MAPWHLRRSPAADTSAAIAFNSCSWLDSCLACCKALAFWVFHSLLTHVPTICDVCTCSGEYFLASGRPCIRGVRTDLDTADTTAPVAPICHVCACSGWSTSLPTVVPGICEWLRNSFCLQQSWDQDRQHCRHLVNTHQHAWHLLLLPPPLSCSGLSTYWPTAVPLESGSPISC
jgi:hypothetical protein